jgi:general secretion pathway protein F
MMRFQAKVMDGQLRVRAMTLDAGSEPEARHVIDNAGLQVLDLRPAGMTLPQLGRGMRFDLAVFNQQLHSLLAAGQTVSEAVDILSRNDRSDRHRDVYRTLLEELRRGRQFSDAMAGLPSVFPPLYVAMVRASETTGAVRLSVQRFMLYQRQIDEIRKKLSSAAIYPAILIAVGFAVVAFLMLYVVPRFSVVFDGTAERSGGSGAFIRTWGGFVRENTTIAWLGFASIGAAFLAVIVNPAAKIWAARRISHLPWIGERLRILQLARLYRTLSLLLRSGVTLVPAVRMAQASLPLTMQVAVGKVTQAVSEGCSLSVVMAEQGLATEVAQRLLVAGEASGDLENMMEHIADFYDQEVSMWIDAASRLIEPVLMAGIGLIIGAIVLMLYMPIFDMANVT